MNKELKKFNIKNSVYNIVLEEEKKLKDIFNDIDKTSFINSSKVLSAFKKANILESDFSSSTGYGYNDIGRDKIEKVFSYILGSESSLVRTQFISGTHALTVCLFSLLRPNDTLLSITGIPYDTLHEVIGIKDNPSSLKSYGINFKSIDLVNNDFDIDTIKNNLNDVKVVYIQRSRGYTLRKSITIDKLEKIIKYIRSINKDVIIMVDNCYCEFVEDKTPIEVGADIMVGSLIKNLGGGIASNGAYIAGKNKLIDLASERLTVPGEGREVGPSLGFNKELLMGIYHAPYAVASSLKIAILTSKVMERLGYMVDPKYDEKRCDIVETIIFNNKEKLINYANGIQSASPIDSNATLVPSSMPGYKDKIIMASGSFTQGSSIEISCDGPLKKPYVLYQQGSLTYDYGKIAIMSAISNIIDK